MFDPCLNGEPEQFDDLLLGRYISPLGDSYKCDADEVPNIFILLISRSKKSIKFLVVLLEDNPDLSLAPVRFYFLTMRCRPLPRKFRIQSTGNPVPVYATSFDSYVFLDKLVNAGSMSPDPRAIERVRSPFYQKIVYGLNGRFKIHGINFI